MAPRRTFTSVCSSSRASGRLQTPRQTRWLLALLLPHVRVVGALLDGLALAGDGAADGREPVLVVVDALALHEDPDGVVHLADAVVGRLEQSRALVLHARRDGVVVDLGLGRALAGGGLQERVEKSNEEVERRIEKSIREAEERIEKSNKEVELRITKRIEKSNKKLMEAIQQLMTKP